jgi:hypothetical protein
MRIAPIEIWLPIKGNILQLRVAAPHNLQPTIEPTSAIVVACCGETLLGRRHRKTVNSNQSPTILFGLERAVSQAMLHPPPNGEGPKKM